MSAIDYDESILVAPEPSLRRYVIAGLVAIGVGVGGFLLWGFVAALDRAAIADGTVVVDSNKKTVQHLEGGIIKELLVREGDTVKEGDVLLRLDPVQTESALSQIETEQYSRLTRITRLTAEQQGAEQLTFPAEILEHADDPAVKALVASQQALFQARRSAYVEGVNMRHRKIGEIENQIVGMKSQIAANHEMREIAEKQLVTVRDLYTKGLAQIPRLRGLESEVAELGGKIGELNAAISGANESIAGLKIEIENLKSTRASEVAAELQQVLAEGSDYVGRHAALTDVQGRLELRAPQSGRVVNLQVFGAGAVLQPGQPVLDIVPQDEKLLVEAKIKTDDIDTVHVGLPAEVRLLAYKQRRVPPIHGKVVTVSADRFVEEQSGVAFYTARIELDLSSVPPDMNVAPYPGMPAEVLIAAGERRAIDYFLSPITDSWNRAFREE